jgi:hypothetical protein
VIATKLVALQQRTEQRRYRALARTGGRDLSDWPEERVVSWAAAEGLQPATTNSPGRTVEAATQTLGAQPASPADAAAWRRAGSPTSWIAWYDWTARITMAAGPRHVVPGKGGTNGVNYSTAARQPSSAQGVPPG